MLVTYGTPQRPSEVLKRKGKCQELIIKLKELWEVPLKCWPDAFLSLLEHLQAVGWAAGVSAQHLQRSEMGRLSSVESLLFIYFSNSWPVGFFTLLQLQHLLIPFLYESQLFTIFMKSKAYVK